MDLSLENNDDIICSIEASDVSNTALSCSYRGARPGCVCLWDLRTSQSVRKMEGHNSHFSISMDSASRTAASGSTDKTVKLWDVGSG